MYLRSGSRPQSYQRGHAYPPWLPANLPNCRLSGAGAQVLPLQGRGPIPTLRSECPEFPAARQTVRQSRYHHPIRGDPCDPPTGRFPIGFVRLYPLARWHLRCFGLIPPRLQRQRQMKCPDAAKHSLLLGEPVRLFHVAIGFHVLLHKRWPVQVRIPQRIQRPNCFHQNRKRRPWKIQ